MTPRERASYAAGVVARRVQQPEYAGTSLRMQIDAITAWTEPLPANRPWLTAQREAARRRTSRLGVVADSVVDGLEPAPGTRPQPQCPLTCWVTHRDDQDHVA